MPILATVIARVDSVKPNPYTNDDKTNWINKVEGFVAEKLMPTYRWFEISRIKDQAAYTMIIPFLNIVKAWADERPFEKIDARSLNKTGYFMDSDGKLNIYPVPTVSDVKPGLKFIYMDNGVGYDYTEDCGRSLLVTEPYDEIYDFYLMARMDLAQNELDSYQNNMTLYNAAWSDLAKRMNKTVPREDIQIKLGW